MKNAVNADMVKMPGVDKAFDFEKTPYPFEDNTFDEIHAYFILEHLDNHFEAMQELHRILKKGGVLYIRVPHGSGCYGQWGEFTHKRGYGYRAFDIFSNDSNRGYYSDVRFKTKFCKLKYFLTYPYDFYKYNIWFPHWEKFWYAPIVKFGVNTIQALIDLNPEIFERFWWPYVGGAAEVYVELEKV
jgi:SAM-dependent methyltransferase